MNIDNDNTVIVGNGVVTIKKKGSSTAVIANILGQTSKRGIQHIYLDRLVHRPHEKQIGDYAASGAVSTILTKA